ncbi:hypothetical protein D9611_010234 [Ephemerocybe angulata]|uniref:Uncharacterized protein n=2 Tax=Ephemerocybe angulata TaxID=980116 RepID=A0A8H6HLC6_9AGAR|nr:hypothetical protein D9611_010234 [Tulosesus angulatus]KAF6747826.1 hypothetical protein DFP72DRAFT_1049915 [Tulosesus angulatus]
MSQPVAPLSQADEDLSQLCSRFLTHVFGCPEEHSIGDQDLPPLPEYIHVIQSRTQLHSSVSFIALMLIARLKARCPTATGTSGHRLFLSALMLASKMTHDEAYNNRSWTIVVAEYFSLREVNRMEREMCKFLEWDLLIDGAALAAFERAVRDGFSQDGGSYSSSVPLPYASRRIGQAATPSIGGRDSVSRRERRAEAAASSGGGESPDLYHGGDPEQLVGGSGLGEPHPLKGRMYSIVMPSTY